MLPIPQSAFEEAMALLADVIKLNEKTKLDVEAINKTLKDFEVALKKVAIDSLSASQLLRLAESQIQAVLIWHRNFATSGSLNYEEWLDKAAGNLRLIAKKDLATKDCREVASLFSGKLQHVAIKVQLKNDNFYRQCSVDACKILEKIPEKERLQQDWISLHESHSIRAKKLEDENPKLADILYETCQYELQKAGEFPGYLYLHASLAFARTRVYFALGLDDETLACAETALSLIRHPQASAASMEIGIIALQGHTHFSMKNIIAGIRSYLQVFDRCAVGSNVDERKSIDDVFIKFSRHCCFLEKDDFRYQLVEFIYKIFIGEATKENFNQLVNELILIEFQDGNAGLIEQFNNALDTARKNVAENRNTLLVKSEFGKALNDPDILAKQQELREFVSSPNHLLLKVFAKYTAQKVKGSEARMKQLAGENEELKTQIKALESENKKSTAKIEGLERNINGILKRLDAIEKPQQSSNPYSFLHVGVPPASVSLAPPAPLGQTYYKYNPPTQRK